MVEIQQTTSGIMGEIFWMGELSPEYKNKVSLDPVMAYKATADPDIIYLREAIKQPD